MTDQELGRLFAEKVLGWHVEERFGWAGRSDAPYRDSLNRETGHWLHKWHPCTDIAQAMLGMEKLNAHHKLITIQNWSDGTWTVHIYESMILTEGMGVVAATDKTLSRAMVQAVLKTVGDAE